jgi:hypothetical protein
MENTEHCCDRSFMRRALIRNWGIEKRIDKGEKEAPEKMLRSLQGIFCKGRYQSWVLKHEKNRKKRKRQNSS